MGSETQPDPSDGTATVTVSPPPEPEREERNGDEPRDGDVVGLKSALRTERSSRRDAEKELTDARTRLKEFEDRDKTELERVVTERDELRGQLTKLQTDSLKKQIATEVGMAELWEWLQGESAQQLRANAVKLREQMGGPQPTDGGARQVGGPPEAVSMDDRIRRAAGRG